MGFLDIFDEWKEIFDGCPGYIYFCILGMFDGCPGDILLVSWKYLI